MQLLRLLENVSKLKPGSKWMLTKTMSVTYDGDHPDYPVMSSITPIEEFDIGKIKINKVENNTVYFQFVESEDGPDSREMRTHQSTFLDCAEPLREYNRKFLQGLMDPDVKEDVAGPLQVGQTYFITGHIWPGTIINGKTQHPRLSNGRVKITRVGQNQVYFTHAGSEYWCKIYKLMNNVSRNPPQRDVDFLNGLIAK